MSDAEIKFWSAIAFCVTMLVLVCICAVTMLASEYIGYLKKIEAEKARRDE